MASIHEVANFLWAIADEVLRDDFKRGKYPDVILPFVVLRRLDCVLAPTKEKVLKRQAELKAKGVANPDGQLRKTSGYAFYNLSKYDFQKLLDDPKNIAKNLRDYINGFSENVRDILDKFKIRNTIDTLEENDLLFLLVQKFADPKMDLHPDSLSNHDMGYVFEELLRRFNEQSNENPGEHFTPREVIRLMVRLVLNGDAGILKQQAVLRTVYDPTCGTGGMLSIAKEYVLDHINPQADIRLFGQEVNPETYAVAKSDMLIKGDDRDADNICFGSTLSNDGHTEKTFDYQLANPPYGKDWSKDADAIFRERDSATGLAIQENILYVLGTLNPKKLWKNREDFITALKKALKANEVTVPAALFKAIVMALSERDETADACMGTDGLFEPDTELRDTECVPLKESIKEYFQREVAPHVPAAWINEDVRDEKDGTIGKVGYEINFDRYFYRYEPPRPLDVIDSEIKQLEAEIAMMLKEMTT